MYVLFNFLNIIEPKFSVWILDDLCTKLMMPIKLETKKTVYEFMNMKGGKLLHVQHFK